MNMLYRLAVPMLALIGMIDSGYITYEKFSGIVPPCSPGFACETVLTSAWSSIGPIPLSALGFLFYTTLFLLGSLFVLEREEISAAGVRFSVLSLIVGLTGFGFLFSLYLVFIMGVIIKGWCLYCLISAGVCTTLFFVGRLLAADTYPLRLSIMALLYRRLFKPLAFLLDPELVHNHMVHAGKILGYSSLTRAITAWVFSSPQKKNVKKIAGIVFPNPVGLSAGFDYDGNLTDILPSVGFGFATIGTVTLEPYVGNPRPMLSRFPRSQGLLVNKGFKSEGAHAVIARLSKKKFTIPIGISIGSTNTVYRSLDEQISNIISCFKLFERSKLKHAYYELNISCPNTKGGQPFTTKARLASLLRAVDALHIKRPVFLKMPIDLPKRETLDLLDVAKSSSMTGVIFGNLTKDHENPRVHPLDRDVWKTKPGGVSGRPTWDRSQERIKWTRERYGKRFVIIGTGGIFSGEDAIAKMDAGADLVALITGMIYEGPQLLGEISWKLAHKGRMR